MTTELRVLIVEDSEQDTILLVRKLKEAGYNSSYKRVQTAEEMKSALEQQDWDVILSDYVMPEFSGLAALEILQQTGIDIPFIVVSGHIGEDVAVEMMKAGASDYLMKGSLKRLGSAIARELVEAENRRQKRHAERELAKSESELRVLSHRLIKIQEDERRKLARELHDEVGHTLAYVRMLVDRVQGEVENKNLKEAKDALTALMDQIRSLSLSLKPPMLEEDGLVQAVKYLVDRYSRETGINIDYSFAALPQNLQWDMSLAVYRIIQESLTNIIKHAKAGEVFIRIWMESNRLNLSVRDNGIGFKTELPDKGAGLRGMSERANILGGELKIASEPGSGTSITAFFPVALLN